MLDAPPVLHEFIRQPVEQFRMGRRDTQSTEVCRCWDQTFAEVMQPDPIHDHSCDQRIVPAGSSNSNPFLDVSRSLQKVAVTLCVTSLQGIAMKNEVRLPDSAVRQRMRLITQSVMATLKQETLSYTSNPSILIRAIALLRSTTPSRSL